MISINDEFHRKSLAVTLGDPAGIGPEIILKSYLGRIENSLPTFIVYGCHKTLQARAQLLRLECPIIEVSSVQEGCALFDRGLPVLPFPVPNDVRPGEPHQDNSKITLDAIKRATHDAIKNDVAAIVTNPISKAVLYETGFMYPGHTEYLAHLAETFIKGPKYHPVMMIVSKFLRVVPVTIHIPISEIPKKLSRNLIEKTIRSTWIGLKEDFNISHPRISVTGLNPHAGEKGTIGREEIDVIKPVIEELKVLGMNINGPYSADTLFNTTARSSYDAAVCMYHDQGLIPIKTLDFDNGVNFTLGLPFVRTSPDHGTAFDIAPLGIASPNSFMSALKVAAEISERRLKIKLM